MMDSSERLQYQPAIDGLRAVAVALVLLFHGGWTLFSGGYVGVSLFFTISGFLITSLLIQEFESTATISLKAFYARRMKRLLPASAVCLVVISLLAWRGYFASVEGLQSDINSAALQVFNWRALFRGQSYAALIGASQPRPLDHFWSLSIEEQFYWLWPIAMLFIMRKTKNARDTFQARAKSIYLITFVFVVLAPVIAKVWGPNAAYWATPARLGEILVGASLAMWLRTSNHVKRVKSSGSLLGCMGFIIVLVSAMTWPSDSGPAYVGIFPIFAIASAATIVGAISIGLFRRVFAHRVLVALGRRSYGIYLIHWPVFILVNSQRFDFGKGTLFAIRIVATLLISWFSYSFIEQPIRHGKVSQQKLFALASFFTALIVIIALAIVPQPVVLFASEVDAGEVSLGREQSSDQSIPTTEVDDLSNSKPIKMVVLGDSTAVALSAGIVRWAKEDLSRARVAIVAHTACGFARATSVEDITGNFHRDCDQALGPQLSDALQLQPSVALLMVGLADSGPMIWSQAEGVLQPNDPRFAEHIHSDYRQLIEQLIAGGVKNVDWLLAPHPTTWWLGNLGHAPESLRTDLTNTWITQLAGEYPSIIHIIRFDEWLEDQEGDDDRSWRPDGLHLSEDSALKVMSEFIGPTLLSH